MALTHTVYRAVGLHTVHDDTAAVFFNIPSSCLKSALRCFENGVVIFFIVCEDAVCLLILIVAAYQAVMKEMPLLISEFSLYEIVIDNGIVHIEAIVQHCTNYRMNIAVQI